MPVSAVSSYASGKGVEKLADGTLIEWGYQSMGSASAGGTINTSVTFPVAFYYTPIVITSAVFDYPHSKLTSVSGNSTTGFTLNLYSEYASTATTAYWIAIGRWKA